MKYYIIKSFLLFLALPFLIAERIPQAKKLPMIPSYQDSLYTGPKSMGKIHNRAIDEASGLVFSRKHSGILYTHNDSGGEPVIYLLDTIGRHIGEINLVGVKNRDWEDIAIGPGPDPERKYIYVGEIGDNDGRYKQIKIFRIPEPDVLEKEMQAKPEVLVLQYPDGPRDAETLMVDPITQDIFILSKRDSVNILYRVPQSAFSQGEYTLQKVMELPFTMSVAGDIADDGSKIIIKNYFTVFYWERKPGETVPDALKRQAKILPYKPEPQGEAIAFDPVGLSYFTLSETRFNIHPVLYRYDKK
ncbi:hypothetical protein [Cecembia calidifontis]|uniref:Integral membrane protein n=1 Tax=Cecembia calidifontis TaxID=1187080 RepID=A0A4Q7P9G7_9BACT|nr:hypothetical protein [Cecembia calidifontis]RZS96814.1 hypothetical protein BC751_2408 [Cecembia calidifontis]